MRSLFVLTIMILIAAQFVHSQGAFVTRDSASSLLSDSSSITNSLSDTTENKPLSVYDIHWVTNCIKSGWKTTDTALVGSGLEVCDTAHPFIMPVDGKFWRGCTYYHSGWDVGTDYGTPVKAALVGKVRFAGYCSGYGKLVITRHYSGMEMYYAHLSKILVTTGQFVEAGDTVGLVGSTGRARGNHLHMEFRLCDRALDIADYYVQNDTIVNLYKIFESNKKQNDPQTAEYHTVVRGDNLWDIANRYGTSVTNLCTLNHISKNSTLRIGQRVRVR
jgi:murein DD-endopeptidase MepM/ murein hydrolase activator NlpD